MHLYPIITWALVITTKDPLSSNTTVTTTSHPLSSLDSLVSSREISNSILATTPATLAAVVTFLYSSIPATTLVRIPPVATEAIPVVVITTKVDKVITKAGTRVDKEATHRRVVTKDTIKGTTTKEEVVTRATAKGVIKVVTRLQVVHTKGATREEDTMIPTKAVATARVATSKDEAAAAATRVVEEAIKVEEVVSTTVVAEVVLVAATATLEAGAEAGEGVDRGTNYF